MEKTILKKNKIDNIIKLNNKKLNKYNNVNEIFDVECSKCNTIIKIDNFFIKTNGKSAREVYYIAKEIFNSSYDNNIFYNKKNKIIITNQDIKESVNKFYNDRLQNIYLKEHLIILSKIGDIIEQAKLVNQTLENKGREKYITWHYYCCLIKINNIKYKLVFDVVSRIDGENHYRLQRIEKADIQSTLP